MADSLIGGCAGATCAGASTCAVSDSLIPGFAILSKMHTASRPVRMLNTTPHMMHNTTPHNPRLGISLRSKMVMNHDFASEHSFVIIGVSSFVSVVIVIIRVSSFTSAFPMIGVSSFVSVVIAIIGVSSFTSALLMIGESESKSALALPMTSAITDN